jgi:methionyl aminopeptidase
MIPLKTSIDVQRIRKTSKVIETIFFSLQNLIRPGITTKEIDAFCENMIRENHAKSSLKGYKGFPSSICASANNIAVHGVPNSIPLENNDIVTVDITLNIDGWHSDAAWTYSVGINDAERTHLVKAAWKTALAGVMAARTGNRLGDIGAAVEKAAKRYGCSVLDDFAGHGIGAALHEDPIIANTGTKGTGQPIVPGMVFTIEPILCLGKPGVHLLDDGWSVVTDDGSLTAQYEHTLAIFRDRTEILTFSSPDIFKNLDAPPFF